MKKKGIACVGLGVMGGPMAAHLLKAGFQVHGVDPDPAAASKLQDLGASVFDNPAQAVAGADAALVMVNHASQVEQVLFGCHGLAGAMAQGSVVWVASTVPARSMVSYGERLSEFGVLTVDGPVSGGKTLAEAGGLTVIAGASEAAIALASPFMAACAERVFHVGDIGAASTIKIINNLLAASHVALTAEAVALASQSGVDAEQLLAVVKHSSGASRMFEKRAARMFAGDHAIHASINTFLKDLDIALEEALFHELAIPVATAARAVFADAAVNGLGQQSDTRLIEHCLSLARQRS